MGSPPVYPQGQAHRKWWVDVRGKEWLSRCQRLEHSCHQSTRQFCEADEEISMGKEIRKFLKALLVAENWDSFKSVLLF